MVGLVRGRPDELRRTETLVNSLCNVDLSVACGFGSSNWYAGQSPDTAGLGGSLFVYALRTDASYAVVSVLL
jgi:hypothetical protein